MITVGSVGNAQGGTAPRTGGRRAEAIVRLAKAYLCVNCEHISEADGARCPCCGSASLLSLARILDRGGAV